jgi:predicted RNA-binding protein with PUA-like domain
VENGTEEEKVGRDIKTAAGEQEIEAGSRREAGVHQVAHQVRARYLFLVKLMPFMIYLKYIVFKESRIEKGVDMKFSLDDLLSEPESTAHWDGVRNYQARNNMTAMKVGQSAFFYHSNTKVPGIVGIVKVAKESYVDHTQFDRADPHFDPKSSKDKPKWYMVDVKYERHLKRLISLAELKRLHLEHKAKGGLLCRVFSTSSDLFSFFVGPLAKMSMFVSARLSVQPLTEQEFKYILNLEED